MIEKFFFTRAVGYRNDSFSGKTGKINDSALYRIPGAFWSIRCYSNICPGFEIAEDISERRNTHLLIRAPDGPHIEELYHPGNEFPVSVTADEDLDGAPFFREGHHEEP